MPVHKSPHHTNYTVLDNNLLRNPNLSALAKCILTIALSLPDTWQFTIGGLAQYCREGKTAIQSAIKELESAGYLHRQRSRQNGQFKEMIYTFAEDPALMPKPSSPTSYCPKTDRPSQAVPHQGTPVRDQPQISNTDILINTIYNPNQSINHIQDQLRHQIDYDTLRLDYDRRLLDDLVGIMLEVMLTQGDMIEVSKQQILPTSYVQQCIHRINALHIEQILRSLENTKPVIKHTRNYLLRSLVNAANTMDATYDYGDL